MRGMVWVMPLAMLAGCGGAFGSKTVQPSGHDGRKSFPAAGFDKVELRGADNVEVRVGPGFAVEARGDAALLDHLAVTVEGGTLKVGRERGWRWEGKPATVTVSLPAISAASIAGAGDMRVDRARGPRFEGSIAGSGDLTVGAIEADATELSIAGSGDVTAAGTARTLNLSIAGSGDIHAAKLTGADLSASIAGSGGIEAAATGTAKLTVMGSGDIAVTGGAKCHVTKMGSGDVTCG